MTQLSVQCPSNYNKKALLFWLWQVACNQHLTPITWRPISRGLATDIQISVEVSMILYIRKKVAALFTSYIRLLPLIFACSRVFPTRRHRLFHFFFCSFMAAIALYWLTACSFCSPLNLVTLLFPRSAQQARSAHPAWLPTCHHTCQYPA